VPAVAGAQGARCFEGGKRGLTGAQRAHRPYGERGPGRRTAVTAGCARGWHERRWRQRTGRGGGPRGARGCWWRWRWRQRWPQWGQHERRRAAHLAYVCVGRLWPIRCGLTPKPWRRRRRCSGGIPVAQLCGGAAAAPAGGVPGHLVPEPAGAPHCDGHAHACRVCGSDPLLPHGAVPHVGHGASASAGGRA
jgi:hypothetical protein